MPDFPFVFSAVVRGSAGSLVSVPQLSIISLQENMFIIRFGSETAAAKLPHHSLSIAVFLYHNGIVGRTFSHSTNNVNYILFLCIYFLNILTASVKLNHSTLGNIHYKHVLQHRLNIQMWA